MVELLAVIRTVLTLLAGMRLPARQVLMQPVITVALLAILHAGMNVIRESSLTEGLRIAYFDNETNRARRTRESENALLQAELRHFVESNRLIGQLLETLLQRMPDAARVRLDVIHNGVVGLNGTGLLRYDITHAVAAPGRATDALVQNQPIADWTDTLPTLLSGQCVARSADAMRNQQARARLSAMAVGMVLACPVADVQGRLLGAILATWDLSDPPPSAAQIAPLMQLGQQIGAQIAAVLDLRGPPPWPAPR